MSGVILSVLVVSLSGVEGGMLAARPVTGSLKVLRNMIARQSEVPILKRGLGVVVQLEARSEAKRDRGEYRRLSLFRRSIYVAKRRDADPVT